MTSERTQKHRRADYQQTLETIRANTGDPQPPMVGATHLWTTLVADGSLEHEFAQSALRAAVENGDAHRWTDGNGTIRYGLTVQGFKSTRGSSPYSPADADALREYIAVETGRESPDTDFVAWANSWLDRL